MRDKKDSSSSEDALKAHLAQLELENKVRRQRQATTGQEPFKDTPRRGFGSAQGIAHLRHQEYQRRGSAPSKPAPQLPAPGKAAFGGTYLRTPLPGLVSPNSEPGSALIPPTPAASDRSSTRLPPLNQRAPLDKQMCPTPLAPIDSDKPGDLGGGATDDSSKLRSSKLASPPDANKNTRLKRFKNPTLKKD